MTNTFIAPGKDNPEDIIADTKKGVLVLKMGGGEAHHIYGFKVKLLYNPIHLFLVSL